LTTYTECYTDKYGWDWPLRQEGYLLTETVERQETKEPQRAQTGVFVNEVILENFMSHDYSRIPLRPGLNVVMGPNGSGKSSILLGISVALGQTYTERAQKLSELIHRGSEVARVSVSLDNSPIDGRRPIPDFPTDRVIISRYLKRTGEYWHYVNNRFRAKAEVQHLLEGLGINPDNILIIMHQNMIEQFSGESTQEKLRMVEDAVGAGRLRARILEAEGRLTELQSEETAVKRSLEEGKAAVDFWREEYEKLLSLRKLYDQKETLEREYVWSQVIQLEAEARRLATRITESMSNIKTLEAMIVTKDGEVAEQREKFITLMATLRRHYFDMVELAKKTVTSNERKAEGSEEKFATADERIGRTEQRIVKAVDDLVEKSVHAELLKERKRRIERQLGKLRQEFDEIDKQLESRIGEARSKGERLETQRRPVEVLEDIRVVSVQIASMGHANREAEEMYLMADSRFRETELKFQQVAENTAKALKEVEHRKEIWRAFLRGLISEVEPMYNQILSLVDARGELMLENLEEVAEAALSVSVGFMGMEPTPLNAQTQSGGERTVATMAFLLALQKHVKSFFRAIDEFDVHLDPLNRERMMKILMATAQGDSSSQYVVMTPGRVNVATKAHFIVVQKVGGKSSVKVAER